MARVYKRVGGHKLEKFLALEPGVQGELKKHATSIRRRAEANLAEVRGSAGYTGEFGAEITQAKGKVDHHIILDDTGSDGAAHVIEFGRPPVPPRKGKNGEMTKGRPAQPGHRVLRNALEAHGRRHWI